MFVRQSTYRDALGSLTLWRDLAKRLQIENSLLKSKILGLEACMQLFGVNRQAAKQLSEEDCKRLLMLIHPDKHGGKQSAVEMTQKILAIRDGQR